MNILRHRRKRSRPASRAPTTARSWRQPSCRDASATSLPILSCLCTLHGTWASVTPRRSGSSRSLPASPTSSAIWRTAAKECPTTPPNSARWRGNAAGPFGRIYLPHDGRHREWGSGRSRIEQVHAEKISSKFPILQPLGDVEEGINAARATIPPRTFDQAACAEGLKALKAYRKEWDEERGCWKDRPRHDWASHCADAFRVLALGWREAPRETVVGPHTPITRLTGACHRLTWPSRTRRPGLSVLWEGRRLGKAFSGRCG